MIDIKAAAQRAVKFVRDLYEGVTLEDLALEEIRLSEDEQWWLVTIGFRTLAGYQEGARSGQADSIPDGW